MEKFIKVELIRRKFKCNKITLNLYRDIEDNTSYLDEVVMKVDRKSIDEIFKFINNFYSITDKNELTEFDMKMACAVLYKNFSNKPKIKESKINYFANTKEINIQTKKKDMVIVTDRSIYIEDEKVFIIKPIKNGYRLLRNNDTIEYIYNDDKIDVITLYNNKKLSIRSKFIYGKNTSIELAREAGDKGSICITIRKYDDDCKELYKLVYLDGILIRASIYKHYINDTKLEIKLERGE